MPRMADGALPATDLAVTHADHGEVRIVWSTFMPGVDAVKPDDSRRGDPRLWETLVRLPDTTTRRVRTMELRPC